MRKFLFVISLFIIVPALVGCGGSKSLQSTDEGNVPDWFTNPPSDPNYFFSPSTATSQDLQLAIDKATTGARAEIGRQVDVKVKALQKRFDEEVGMGENAELMQQFTSATKTVVSTSLSGSRVSKQKQSRDGSIWRAYVLVEYPIGEANQALLNQIKKSQNMYTRFRASEAFKELEEETTKYDEWKKGQMQQ
jgi:hypothetical protein